MNRHITRELTWREESSIGIEVACYGMLLPDTHPGKVFGAFGYWYDESKLQPSVGYAVTHLATGRRVWAFRDEATAQAFTEELVKLGEWESENVDELVSRYRADIARLVNEYDKRLDKKK